MFRVNLLEHFQLIVIYNYSLWCRPLSKKTFEEAQKIYEEFVESGNLPDGIHSINIKDSYPILEYTIVNKNSLFYLLISNKIKILENWKWISFVWKNYFWKWSS